MVKAVTADGRNWDPQFIKGINEDACMGCGRCFKVCGQNVFTLVDSNTDDDDDWGDDEPRMVMTLGDPGNCIGCGACERVCPTGCHQH